MKIKQVWFAAFGAAIVVNAIGWIAFRMIRPHSDYAYVDVMRLTQGYKLKADLEQDLFQRLQPAKNVLDSLRFQAGLQAGPGATAIQRRYEEAAFEYERATQSVDAQLSSQVWERLNPAIAAFGREHHLKLLVGATGTGNVLYGDTTLDLTNALIKYVNEAYSGHR